MKELVRTVNKSAPRNEFILWAANDKGYCPKSNREIIGICNARIIVKKLFKLTGNQVEVVLNKIQDEGKFLVFGKGVDPYFDTKIRTTKNVMYLGVKE